MRVYLESTIPSYLVARPARDLRQAARQQVANAVIESRLRGLVEKFSYTLPILCTPDVLIGESTGEIDE